MLEIVYSQVPQTSDELYHWKYLKRYKENGKWRYVYDTKLLKSNVGSSINKLSQKVTSAVGVASNKMARVYDKTFTNNIYATNNWNYDEKIKQVEKTKEWQDIVARKDPEYCVLNKDGTYTYKIDDYLVKKKHQGLDMLDDIASGRPVTTNDMSVDTLVAGAQDYIEAGIAYIAVRAKILMTAMKYRQGSYKDDIDNGKSKVDDGIKAINKILSTYSNTDNLNVNDILSNPEVKKIISGYDSSQLTEVKKEIEKSLRNK